MNKLRRIEVEPLTDERWSRLERSLFARLEQEKGDASPRPVRPGRVRRGIWLVAAALACVATLLLVRGRPQAPAVVEQPSHITTGATASHLALPGLSLDVQPESAVVIGTETAEGLLIVVDRGGVVCKVAPRTSGAPLIVQAGAVRVRVVGTHFSVTRLGDAASVEVREGVVEVSADGQTWSVHAGERWPTETAARSKVAERPAPNALSPAPAEVAPPSSATRVGRQTPTAVKSHRASEPAAPSETPQPKLRPQAVFERAAALERDEPQGASELYATLESGSDSWAQNALYAHGRLEASRGHRAAARRLLERYLERFPRGSNAEDARAVLERLK